MVATSNSVQNLLNKVKRLSPYERSQFAASFAQLQESWHAETSDEFLVQQTRNRLSPADMRRLRKLAAKSENGEISQRELKEYQLLNERAERINASCVRALAELARRRNQSIDAIKREVRWHEESHDA
jgi:hypothetical protein